MWSSYQTHFVCHGGCGLGKAIQSVQGPCPNGLLTLSPIRPFFGCALADVWPKVGTAMFLDSSSASDHFSKTSREKSFRKYSNKTNFMKHKADWRHPVILLASPTHNSSACCPGHGFNCSAAEWSWTDTNLEPARLLGRSATERMQNLEQCREIVVTCCDILWPIKL